MSGKKKKRLLAHYTIAAIERNVTIRLWFRVIERIKYYPQITLITQIHRRELKSFLIGPFLEKKICVICG